MIDLRPLRHGAPFRWYWGGGLLAGLGAQIAVVAVLFQVWEMTRNPFWVGAIGLVQAVPMIVFGLIGGPVADVLDRRLVGLWSTAVQAVTALVLGAQLVLGLYPLPLLLTLIGVQTAASALGSPARRTFTVRLLPAHLVAAGVALHMIGFQVTMMIGPALGGLIIGGAGVAACYLVNAVFLVVSWWSFRKLPASRAGVAAAVPEGEGAGEAGDRIPEKAFDRVWRRTRRGLVLIGEGVDLVRRDPVLRGSFLLDLAATLLAFPIALFPMVNQELFDGDPRTLGFFLTAVAVGGVTAGIFSGLVTRAPRLGRVQLLAVAAWGVGTLGFGLGAATSPWLALGSLVLAGAADTVSVTSRAAMVQLATADSHLGRVSSVEHVIAVAGPDLGNARAGAVAGLTTPAAAAVIGALACLAVGAWVALTHREIAGFSLVEGQGGPAS
ncbi:MFS transporter [Ornithinimicrobium panacihumi]|uniref:MFS transporter n=1 Tax=Ornithinimicrobium panacihumi TaxID=2008449 RepID=UPI003F8C200D